MLLLLYLGPRHNGNIRSRQVVVWHIEREGAAGTRPERYATMRLPLLHAETRARRKPRSSWTWVWNGKRRPIGSDPRDLISDLFREVWKQFVETETIDDDRTTLFTSILSYRIFDAHDVYCHHDDWKTSNNHTAMRMRVDASSQPLHMLLTPRVRPWLTPALAYDAYIFVLVLTPAQSQRSLTPGR